MAYIPTIRTFEDDINENRRFDEAPISGGLEKINYENKILVPEEKKSSLTKKVLTFIGVLFIAASLALLGYYFYNAYLERQEEARLLAEATQRQEEAGINENILSELSKILPKLSPGISPYVQAAVQKNNIIILTIKDSGEGIDNYSALYSYILAHPRDLNSDLFYAFKVEEATRTNTEENYFAAPEFPLGDTNTSTQSPATTSVSNSTELGILDPKPMLSSEIIWERKTLYNQDFQTANAGVTTLVYGYVNKKYLIITTHLNDFFETLRSVQQ